MTNWAHNTLTLHSTDATLLAEVVAGLREGASHGAALTFEAVLPLGEWDYDRAVSTWGTKWDADLVELEEGPTTLTYTFNTAYAPPVPVVQRISARWPALVVHLAATEESNAFLTSTYLVDGREVLVTDEDPDDHLALAGCDDGCGEDCDGAYYELVEPEWLGFTLHLAEEFAPVRKA